MSEQLRRQFNEAVAVHTGHGHIPGIHLPGTNHRRKPYIDDGSPLPKVGDVVESITGGRSTFEGQPVQPLRGTVMEIRNREVRVRWDRRSFDQLKAGGHPDYDDLDPEQGQWCHWAGLIHCR